MTETIKTVLAGALATAGGSAVFGWVGSVMAWKSKIGTRVAVMEQQQETLGEWLERVEQKLDRAIERRR